MIEEYEILLKKLETILPFEAYPIRELVVQLRNKFPITLKSKLMVEDVYNSNDISGIGCTIKFDDEGLACGLTHLIVPNSNRLYKEITAYQEKR
jgi:hypothetical protein